MSTLSGLADTGALTVMVVHNQYQLSGGEDSVVDAETQLLRQHGHKVITYQRSNHELSEIGQGSAALQSVWSRRTQRDLLKLIDEHRPAVVHVHNTFPLISPSVYWAAERAGIPVVQTLHNFRLICPQALLLRNGHVCEDCVGHSPWRAVLHACYRGSHLQSAAAATVVQLHRTIGTWQKKVSRYITLNEFCRDRFIAGGLPAERLVVKPNFIDLPSPICRDRRNFLFVGRLSAEKGVSTLVQAMHRTLSGCELHVFGEGPLQPMIGDMPRITAKGMQPRPAVLDAMAGAAALVVPSICYENFPMVIVEAFASGLPVICSRLGGMATLVEHGVTGWLVMPGDAAELAARLDWAHAHPGEMTAMGQRARTYYEKHLTAERNYRLLTEIYRDAIAESAREVME